MEAKKRLRGEEGSKEKERRGSFYTKSRAMAGLRCGGGGSKNARNRARGGQEDKKRAGYLSHGERRGHIIITTYQ